ncbi:methyl-CpG-binding domain protein 3-like [Dendronephthya gigantea]|uniref:methyl-CpG-binding domain protein 3-like n=1 Tax=Dendronephthya gigantea TaxID=151771 RepID=UPI00106C3AE3|nr:methyl-CpG-binding domain protein 3-like [Dendronephthya gigantea]
MRSDVIPKLCPRLPVGVGRSVDCNMEVLPEPEPQIEVKQLAETPPQTNGSVEEKSRTPCEALPGWTRVVVMRKSGSSAGKSDVYYYSPTGKKVRSKPDMEKLLFQMDGGVEKDLSKFDYRTGTFVDRTTTRKRKKPICNIDAYGKDFCDYNSMASMPYREPKTIDNTSVTFVSKNPNPTVNGLDSNLVHVSNGNEMGLVSPRQIYWERRLQNMNGKNGLVDFDIFSETNGEFCSLLHSIVMTLQIERDIANEKIPKGTHKGQPLKKPIKITKADIRKQEKMVIKARRELAKAITEYEALKCS